MIGLLSRLLRMEVDITGVGGFSGGDPADQGGQSEENPGGDVGQFNPDPTDDGGQSDDGEGGDGSYNAEDGGSEQTFGNFKTPEEVYKAYQNSQQKISQQGKEHSELKQQYEQLQNFIRQQTKPEEAPKKLTPEEIADKLLNDPDYIANEADRIFEQRAQQHQAFDDFMSESDKVATDAVLEEFGDKLTPEVQAAMDELVASDPLIKALWTAPNVKNFNTFGKDYMATIMKHAAYVAAGKKALGIVGDAKAEATRNARRDVQAKGRTGVQTPGGGRPVQTGKAGAQQAQAAQLVRSAIFSPDTRF